MSPKKLRFLEFLLVGLLMNMAEDTAAVYFSSGLKISWDIVMVVFLTALPFAFISEYIVDHPKFWKTIFKNSPSANIGGDEGKK